MKPIGFYANVVLKRLQEQNGNNPERPCALTVPTEWPPAEKAA